MLNILRLIAFISFFLASNTALAQANNKLPPDWFKVGNGQYEFKTELEVPCQTEESGFCPNPELAQKGWVIARYKSRHAGGFDRGTPSLLMVYVPPGEPVNGQADTTHRWLNFALPADTGALEYQATPRAPIPRAHGANDPRTFTMVSLTPGNPGTVHFNMFRRSGSSNAYTARTDPVGVERGCYKCHPNGLRAIAPWGYNVTDHDRSLSAELGGGTRLGQANWDRVKKINDAMERAGRGAVQWEEGFVPANITKLVGSISDEAYDRRTKEYIEACAKRKPVHELYDIFRRAPGKGNVYKQDANFDLNWEDVAAAMECAGCHDHDTRGAITDRIGQDQIDFKILVDQTMPPGVELDINHRIALVNCLHTEVGR